MLHFSRWTIISIILVCLAGFVAAAPNFFSKETVDAFPDFLPKKQLSLGLDLRGGAHLLLQMDENNLRKDWLGALRAMYERNCATQKSGSPLLASRPRVFASR